MEHKGSLTGGDARICRVAYSKSGRSLYYRGSRFEATKSGYKYNYIEVETGERYWITGPKKGGGDRLYNERVPIQIDEDVREEYWLDIRGEESQILETVITPPNA